MTQPHYAAFEDTRSLFIKVWVEPEEADGYDQMQVWRSETGQGGVYTELTGPMWRGAQLVATVGNNTLVDNALELLVGSTHIEVVFAGANPLSTSDVGSQIVQAAAGLLYSSVDGTELTLTTNQPGNAARLQCIGGDAAPIIGLATEYPENLAYGTDARIRLTGARAYEFRDIWGQEGWFYKTRLYNSSTDAVSEFSHPFQRNKTRLASPSQLARGYCRLVDMTGRPVAGRTVLLNCPYVNTIIEGLLLVGGDETLTSDSEGYVSTLLLKGAEIDVAVAGTALARRITVPDVDSFNLFDASVGSDDAFVVRVPEVQIAARNLTGV